MIASHKGGFVSITDGFLPCIIPLRVKTCRPGIRNCGAGEKIRARGILTEAMVFCQDHRCVLFIADSVTTRAAGVTTFTIGVTSVCR